MGSDGSKLSKQELIKQQTIELYDQLPQDKEGRMARTDIRDKIIDLNYSFFGYVATHTFINNTSITYEDKFQSALLHFCECWWWYRWEGHYRTDLSFSVFFKPRIGEMIERELNEVKYSIRRTLCMKAGAQLGKHWAQVRYEDLAHVNLPADELNALKAMFGTLYWADLEQHELYIESPKIVNTEFVIGDEYDDIPSLLMSEMVDLERPLTDKDFKSMADMYDIDINLLHKYYPAALQKLHARLKHSQDNQI